MKEYVKMKETKIAKENVEFNKFNQRRKDAKKLLDKLGWMVVGTILTLMVLKAFGVF